MRTHGLFQKPNQESPFQKGDLKYVILGLINDNPRHGYEIIRILEEHSHGLYTPSPGAIYPTLQLLEEMGYIEVAHQDTRKIYQITDEGKQFLADREQFAEGIKQQMKDHWSTKNTREMQETMAEIGRMGRLIGRRFRHMDTDKGRRIREVVAQSYRDIENILDQ